MPADHALTPSPPREPPSEEEKSITSDRSKKRKHRGKGAGDTVQVVTGRVRVALDRAGTRVVEVRR